MQSVNADTFLAGAHEKGGHEPLVQGNFRAFKENTHSNAELLATVFAFPYTLTVSLAL
jgi:hypothetical protein